MLERRREEEERRRREEERQKQLFIKQANSYLRSATIEVMNYLFQNIGRGDKASLRSNYSESNITYNYQSRTAYIPIVISWTRYINWINDTRDTTISGYIYYDSNTCEFICSDAINTRSQDAELIYQLKEDYKLDNHILFILFINIKS